MKMLPIEILVKVFEFVDSPVTLWQDVPMVCRNWWHASQYPVIKKQLVQQLWFDQTKNLNVNDCVEFYNNVCSFRSLRHKLQTIVATIIAYARLSGIAAPKLFIYDKLFNKIEWNKLLFTKWKYHPGQGVVFMKDYVKLLEEY
ncbi:MAG: hypothetical protein DRI46_10640, partial [Chloroflexi bacterium]